MADRAAPDRAMLSVDHFPLAVKGAFAAKVLFVHTRGPRRHDRGEQQSGVPRGMSHERSNPAVGTCPANASGRTARLSARTPFIGVAASDVRFIDSNGDYP